MRSRILIAAATLALCASCSGCAAAEAVPVLGPVLGFFLWHEKMKHPVASAIAENPSQFWSLLATIVTAIVTIFTLCHKAGKDHKRKER